MIYSFSYDNEIDHCKNHRYNVSYYNIQYMNPKKMIYNVYCYVSCDSCDVCLRYKNLMKKMIYNLSYDNEIDHCKNHLYNVSYYNDQRMNLTMMMIYNVSYDVSYDAFCDVSYDVCLHCKNLTNWMIYNLSYDNEIDRCKS